MDIVLLYYYGCGRREGGVVVYRAVLFSVKVGQQVRRGRGGKAGGGSTPGEKGKKVLFSTAAPVIVRTVRPVEEKAETKGVKTGGKTGTVVENTRASSPR